MLPLSPVHPSESSELTNEQKAALGLFVVQAKRVLKAYKSYHKGNPTTLRAEANLVAELAQLKLLIKQPHIADLLNPLLSRAQGRTKSQPNLSEGPSPDVIDREVVRFTRVGGFREKRVRQILSRAHGVPIPPREWPASVEALAERLTKVEAEVLNQMREARKLKPPKKDRFKEKIRLGFWTATSGVGVIVVNLYWITQHFESYLVGTGLIVQAGRDFLKNN